MEADVIEEYCLQGGQEGLGSSEGEADDGKDDVRDRSALIASVVVTKRDSASVGVGHLGWDHHCPIVCADGDAREEHEEGQGEHLDEGHLHHAAGLEGDLHDGACEESVVAVLGILAEKGDTCKVEADHKNAETTQDVADDLALVWP